MSMATSLSPNELEHLSADHNPYGCPFGVWWLIRMPSVGGGLARDIRVLGHHRVQWRGNLVTAPHFHSDSAWLLDGKPATIDELHRAATRAA